MANRILADVNVCLDLLLDRKPHVEYSGRIFELAEQKKITLLISGISVDTIFYVMRPAMGASAATKTLNTLLGITGIAEVNEQVVREALEAGWSDLEDALQFYTAKHAGCSYLITRDPGGFKQAVSEPIIQTPKQFFESL
jgi:predicted nucleic acid-binding protein